MVGIIVQLLISWVLLWAFYRKDLSVLGWKPAKNRLAQFGAGFLLAAFCCTLYNFMTTAFVDNSWVLNRTVTGTTVWQAARWQLISVLYEELIFRGALLYIAIRKIGIWKACILSAVCFGIYHWFSFNVMGNPVMMVITFLMTAIVGLSWAFAFAKTGSLYLPVALHFGWNLTLNVLFSNQSQGLLHRANGNQLEGAGSLFVFLFQVLALPLLTFWYLRRLSPEYNIRSEEAGTRVETLKADVQRNAIER